MTMAKLNKKDQCLAENMLRLRHEVHWIKDGKKEHTPPIIPEMTVANRGVWKRGEIVASQRNSKPSSAIAYTMRGRGNIEPRRLRGQVRKREEKK